MRIIRLAAVAATLFAVLGVGRPADAKSVGPTFTFHYWTNTGSLDTTESFDPPGDKPIVGDFTGATDTDAGHADDIFWYTPGAGGDGLWRSNGDRNFFQTAISVSGDYTPVVGFFGDDTAKEDILWLSATGPSSLWDFNADGSITKTSFLSVQGAGQVLLGDFTGDAHTDVITYQPGAAHDGFFDFNGDGTLTVRSLSINGSYRPATGHFTNDLVSDILWYAPGSAPDSLWDFNSGGSVTQTAQTVNGTYTPIVRTKTEDGADDIVWYGFGTLPDAYWDFNGATRTNLTATINGHYTPVTCECLGEEHFVGTDILWYGAGNSPDVVWDFTAMDINKTVRTYASPNLGGAGVAGIGHFDVSTPNDGALVYDLN